jgi:hypothetical protein
MEPGGSLPHSQEPATCPYPDHFNNTGVQIPTVASGRRGFKFTAPLNSLMTAWCIEAHGT